MLLSRDDLIATLFRETDRARRMMTPLALILCGIEGDENWRASLNQGAADLVFAEIAARFMRHLRCYDSLGRFGDHGFALILPGCSGFSAVAMAERLRSEAFGSSFKTSTEEIHLTGCFGVAGSGGRSPLVVLRNAEHALKRARTRAAGAIERCSYDTEPDATTFAFPAVRSEPAHL